VNEHANDLVKLVRKSLPIELGIEDEEILQFFRALKPPGASVERTKRMREPKRDFRKIKNNYI
jgi:hypothetical protein